MSRSRKNVPICCWIGTSQKRGKRKCNRKFRRIEQMALGLHDFEQLPHLTREVMDPWDLGGDGKVPYMFTFPERRRSKVLRK